MNGTAVVYQAASAQQTLTESVTATAAFSRGAENASNRYAAGVVTFGPGNLGL